MTYTLSIYENGNLQATDESYEDYHEAKQVYDSYVEEMKAIFAFMESFPAQYSIVSLRIELNESEHYSVHWYERDTEGNIDHD